MIARHIIFFILSTVLGILLIIGIYGIDSYYTQIPKETNTPTCESLGGTFLQEHNECEGISQSDCEKVGGTFEECASACRHDPSAEFCILSCVQVCKLS